MSQQREPGLVKRLELEARRISVQHRQLDEFYRLVVAAAAQGAQPLAEAFAHFAAALRAHFALEDSTHFPALHGSNPALLPVLERLVEDHVRFRAELDAIAALVAGASIDAAVGRLSTLAARLGRHEEEEETIFPGGGGTPA